MRHIQPHITHTVPPLDQCFQQFQPPTQQHEFEQKAHSMHHYLSSQTPQLPLGIQHKVNGVTR